MEPFEWSLTDTLQALTARQCSAEDLVATMLARIEQHNPVLRAFLSVSDRALADARESDQRRMSGQPTGLLEGIPIAVKDLFDTDFLSTTYGGVHDPAHRPTRSATVVQRLQAAGAIVIGKTNLHEYAYGTTTENPHYGNCVNPWNRSKIAGGSSGGSSVALVAGLCTAAIGTDTGGSIRIPAALTGHVGLKPTFGLVPTTGVLPLAPTLDHIGPMTRSVADAALLLEVMAGYDPNDRQSVRIPPSTYLSAANVDSSAAEGRPIRVGVPKRFFFEKCHASVLQTVTDALRKVENARRDLAFMEVEVPDIEEVPDLQSAIIGSEARAIHDRNLRSHPEQYGDDVRTRLLQADAIPGFAYVQAIDFRRRFQKVLQALWKDVDVLVTPTTPLTATDVGQRKAHIRTLEVGIRGHLTRYTNPWNLSGLPAITIPCGLCPDELPAGIQLIGPAWGERKLIAIAQKFEAVLPWRSVAPDYREVQQ